MARRRVAGKSAGTKLPTQRTQYARHAIPQVTSERAGLENMGNVFADFFGQGQRAIANLREEVMVGQRAQIEQENRAEAIQAQTDFYSGRGPDPKLANDLDYMDSFRGLQASRMASAAGRDFYMWYQTEYLPQNPMGDLVAAREEWARTNLMGIEDPEVQAQVLGKFFTSTEGMMGQHIENGIKMQRSVDVTNLNQSIYDEVVAGTMTPERIQWYITASQQIDPMNPMEAAPRVIASIMQSVRNNPQQTQHVIQTLTEAGTGINGRSFAESFPEAFADFQVGALNSYLQTNTMEEYEYFRAIEEEINSTADMTPSAMSQLALKITQGTALYGAGRQADALRAMMAKRFDDLVAKQSAVSYVGQMLDDPGVMDASHLRKHFMDWMLDTHGTKNALEVDPAVLANDIARLSGVVPEDLKAQLSTALTNSANPGGQERVLRMLAAVSAARGEGYVEQYLSTPASNYYAHVSDKLGTDLPLGDAIAQTNDARGTGRLPEDFDWITITGESTLGDAVAVVDSEIDSQVQTHFETNGLFLGPFVTNIEIPENVMGVLRDHAKTIFAERSADGITYQDAVAAAVKRHIGNADIVGTEDQPVLLLRPVSDGVRNEDIGAGPRVQLGPNVMSPAGIEVDTRQIYLDELKMLGENAAWMFPDGNIEDVVINYASSAPGIFQIMQGGSRLVYEVDQEIEVDGQTITIPYTERGLRETFGDILPRGFGFEAQRDNEGGLLGWQLMYRPHFGDYDRSVSDLEKSFSLGQARTVNMMMQDLAQATIIAGREGGIIPMTTGVAQPMPQIRDGADLMDFLDAELARGVNAQGRRFIDRNAVSFDQTYRGRRLKLMTQQLQMRPHAFDATGARVTAGQTPQGDVTVGLGFNMDRPGARDTWREVFGGYGLSFDEVRNGEAAINDEQAQRLFEVDMLHFENVLADAADGRTLPENQHLALLSLAYENPNVIDKIRGDIADGNHNEVIRAILYEDIPASNTAAAVKSRRYQEARMYVGSDPQLQFALPSVQQYLGLSERLDPQLDMRRVQPGNSTISFEGNLSSSDDIRGVVTAAVESVLGAGAHIKFTSGLRANDRGSQHSTGHAADFAVFDSNGRKLRWDDPEVQHIFAVAAQMGALGFGAGPSYMGGEHFHIDLGTGGALARPRSGVTVWSDDDGGVTDRGPGAARWGSTLRMAARTTR